MWLKRQVGVRISKPVTGFKWGRGYIACFSCFHEVILNAEWRMDLGGQERKQEEA
jgi:hypothetical protein